MPGTRGTRSVVRSLASSPSLAWESYTGASARRTHAVRGGLLAQLGYTRREWRGSASFWLDIMPRTDRTRVLALLEATTGRASVMAEFQWTKKDGTALSVEAHLRVLRTRTGEIVGLRGVAFDISARKESERILRESIATRDHFMAMLAHEMRTPISAILGWASWMDEHGADQARSRSALAAIVRCAELQNRLVEDVVDLSRGLFGKLNIAYDVVSVGAVLRAACDAVQPSAGLKRVELELEACDELPCVMGDEGRLVQVVTNLVGNAVKFTPAGGRITITATRLPTHVEIVVLDTGRGVERVELDRLFEPYYQVRGAARLSTGMGLGLFVAKSIIESHGGEIDVDSPGLDRGTRVAVRLPFMAGLARTSYRTSLQSGECEIDGEPSGTRPISKARLPLSA